MTESALDRLRTQLIHLAFAESTHANRKSHLNFYVRFCADYHYNPFPIQALVASRYVAFLASCGRKYGTILNHIASLKHFHQFRGFQLGWEKDYHFSLALQGLKRYLGNTVNRKSAITPSMLIAVSTCFDLSCPLHAAMWALFLVAFFSFLRKSNLVIGAAADSKKVLCRSDLVFTDTGAQLSVRETKTIQYKQRTLSIPLPLISGSRLCPISALRNHLKVNQIASHEPLFSVSSLSNASLLSPVTYSQFTRFLKQSIAAIGEDPAVFSPHSFRRGGATFAFECGLPAEFIKIHGDWRSDAYLVYLEMTEAQKHKAAMDMAHQIHQQQL